MIPKARTASGRLRLRYCARCCRQRSCAFSTGVCDPSCTLPAPRNPKRPCRRCGMTRPVRVMQSHGVAGWACRVCPDDTPVIPAGTPERACRRCHEIMPLVAAFWVRNGARYAWRPECKACRNERRAARNV